MRRYEHGGDVYAEPGVRLDFSVNTNPLGMPEAVRAALVRHMADCERYPDPHCRALSAALAARHGLGAEQILCGNGASDLILRICACLKPRLALGLAPGFSEYERSVRLFGGAMEAHPLREDEGFMLTEEILTRIRPGLDMVFLCNPNNPTGRLAEPALLDALLRACARAGTLLIVDECFLEFTGGASMLARLRDFPNLLILRAFTKLYAMAGLRLGYLMAEAALLKRIAAFGAQWSVSVPAQQAGLAALSTEPDWTRRTAALVEAERRYMREALSALGLWVCPSDACFLLARSGTPLYEPLRRRGFLTRRCENFSGLDARYIRLGVKTHEQNAALIAAMREVLHG
ncbi:MAG: histidinol-phosphate transaminase [Clostridia bacterium]|nr:histidinol-phosphate transaminase [Clostridia bacterium]